jgi:hypothetical protein
MVARGRRRGLTLAHSPAGTQSDRDGGHNDDQRRGGGEQADAGTRRLASEPPPVVDSELGHPTELILEL